MNTTLENNCFKIPNYRSLLHCIDDFGTNRYTISISIILCIVLQNVQKKMWICLTEKRACCHQRLIIPIIINIISQSGSSQVFQQRYHQHRVPLFHSVAQGHPLRLILIVPHALLRQQHWFKMQRRWDLVFLEPSKFPTRVNNVKSYHQHDTIQLQNAPKDICIFSPQHLF